MIEKKFPTSCGEIHYWISDNIKCDELTLVFLPGLTADHRLFEKQTDYFESKYNVFVWDAPAHASSWPFEMNFSLKDKANWLNQILAGEKILHPVLIGQSMGGYVSQMYMEMFSGKIKGFISIDSCPLQRKYMTWLEIKLLKIMEPVYRWYPWKSLLRAGSNGVSTTEYGRKLMHDMMMYYDDDQERYAKLAGHGYKILAEAIEANLSYRISCPALLICGEKDKAGSAKRYNKAWHRNTGIHIEWIKNAGHNANTDAPELVNALILNFIEKLN